MNDDLFLKTEQTIADSGEICFCSGSASEELINAYELSLNIFFLSRIRFFSGNMEH
ncbi:hypothetical protein ACK1MO_004497 [Salmonella enterica]